MIADQIISTCGVIETESLLSSAYQSESKSKTGDFTIIESISVMVGKPKDLNWKETVVFFNDSAKFDYVCPKDPVDLRSGVICIPETTTRRMLQLILSFESPTLLIFLFGVRCRNNNIGRKKKSMKIVFFKMVFAT